MGCDEYDEYNRCEEYDDYDEYDERDEIFLLRLEFYPGMRILHWAPNLGRLNAINQLCRHETSC
jgi:hypothetical protein